jgi:hypothetical protein
MMVELAALGLARHQQPLLRNSMSITYIAAWALALLLLPLLVLAWASESRSTRIQRLRRSGWTWQRIAIRYGVSATTVRRWANA